MVAAEMSNDAVLAFLRAHPSLRSRFASMAAAVDGCGGDLKEADAAEEFLVEEMRLLGREALQGWAETQVRSSEQDLRRQPGLHRQGEKKSAGTRSSGRSRSSSRNTG